MAEKDQTAAQRDGSKEVVAVLEAVIGRPDLGWGVRELAEELDASRSTVNRILAKLVEERLVSRDTRGAYVLGPRMTVLSNALQERHPLFVEGSRILDGLRRATGATALIAVETSNPAECFVLASLEPDAPVRYTLQPGAILPTYAGALGLAILSRRGTGALPADLKKYTEASMDSKERIEAALQSYASIGAVVSIGQHIPDAAGIAVPFTINERLVGSLSLSRPRNEFKDSDIEAVAERLRQAARELESALRDRHAPESSWTGTSESSALISRISAILTAYCAEPQAELSISGLSSLWGTRSVATRRLAEAACDVDLMTKLDNQTWAIGPGLLRWSAAIGAGHGLPELVDDDLRALSEQTGETVTLALYEGVNESPIIARTHTGARNVRYVLEEGSPVPLTAGAAGKVILAHLPEEASAVPAAEAKVPAQELETIRSQGWAITDSERVPDAHGIAAPFFVNGIVKGSVTVTVPNHRVAGTPAGELVAAVVDTARRLTRLLSLEHQESPAAAPPKASPSENSSKPLTIAG